MNVGSSPLKLLFLRRGIYDQGCQIFLRTPYQNGKKHQNSLKYTKWHEIYQHLPMQDPPKFTKISIFGLKICYLATLFMTS
jgi:hypothetical protein